MTHAQIRRWIGLGAALLLVAAFVLTLALATTDTIQDVGTAIGIAVLLDIVILNLADLRGPR